MDTFAKRLQMAIEKMGISQAEAARRCGVSQQSINYIIANDLKQSKLAVGIAESLNLNPNWLIYGEGQYKDSTYYEIPVFADAYRLLKYIHNELDRSLICSTTVDDYFGALTFAYLVEPNKLAICCKKEYDIASMDFLSILGVSVVVSKKPISDVSFKIVEWRSRHHEFKFA